MVETNFATKNSELLFLQWAVLKIVFGPDLFCGKFIEFVLVRFFQGLQKPLSTQFVYLEMLDKSLKIAPVYVLVKNCLQEFWGLCATFIYLFDIQLWRSRVTKL